MIVVNFRLKRKNILLAVAVIIGFIIIGIIAFSGNGKSKSKSENKAISDISLSANTADERTAFLKKMGYETTGEEIERRDVIIPYEFNDVYKNYNKLQKSQGFDLSEYSGCRSTQYCYEIKNYKGYDKTVYAHLLVYQGEIIGGDISAAELNGFMHTFDKSYYLGESKK